jgi:hypothetical protein
MMEAVRTSETSVVNHFIRQYNPEDSSEHHFFCCFVRFQRDNKKTSYGYVLYLHICLFKVRYQLTYSFQTVNNVDEALRGQLFSTAHGCKRKQNPLLIKLGAEAIPLHVIFIHVCWLCFYCFDIVYVCVSQLSFMLKIIRRQHADIKFYWILTPLRKVLLEKLIVTQLLKRFGAFCGTQMFITVFKRCCHCQLNLIRTVTY